MTAYCETCASIANIFWNHRMFLMHGDAKYIDVLERTMLNAALAGISMKGDRFFYPNVLESTGQHARSPWFGCACCPSNVARFIPSIPGFAYAHKGKDVYVNLFLGGNVSMETADNKVTLRQETRYPWEGDVRISVDPEHAERFAIYVRVPGWAQEEPVPSDLYRFVRPTGAAISIRVNGEPVPVATEHGFARLVRRWQAGDTIELDLPMPVRRVVAHRNVAADKGKVALQRGPIVYCLEGPDTTATSWTWSSPTTRPSTPLSNPTCSAEWSLSRAQRQPPNGPWTARLCPLRSDPSLRFPTTLGRIAAKPP
jgi:DUF1680 family protein